MPGASRSKQAARAAVLPFPRQGLLARAARLLPTGRALLVCTLLVVAAVGVYVVSRETSLFAIRTIEVRGVSPAQASRGSRARSRRSQGTSLLALGGDAVTRRVGALPDVLSVTLRPRLSRTRSRSRSCPSGRWPSCGAATSRGSSRRAAGSCAGSTPGQRPGLPRIWVTRQVDVSLGATLSDANALSAVAAVAPLVRVRFPVRVASVETKDGAVTLHLRSGLALIVGDTTDLRLKFVVAKQLLRERADDAGQLPRRERSRAAGRGNSTLKSEV